jgi:hypothetical protein
MCFENIYKSTSEHGLEVEQTLSWLRKAGSLKSTKTRNGRLLLRSTHLLWRYATEREGDEHEDQAEQGERGLGYAPRSTSGSDFRSLGAFLHAADQREPPD